MLKILTIGDSITWGFVPPAPYSQSEGYPAILAGLGYEVENIASGATNSFDWLPYDGNQTGALEGAESADVATVLLGTIDADPAGSTPTEHFKTRIQSLAWWLLEYKVERVILIRPPFRSEYDLGDDSWMYILAYGHALEQLQVDGIEVGPDLAREWLRDPAYFVPRDRVHPGEAAHADLAGKLIHQLEML